MAPRGWGWVSRRDLWNFEARTSRVRSAGADGAAIVRGEKREV